jgi:polyphosphate glucokinase
MQNTGSEERILSIDIGGSRIKGILLDIVGNVLIDYQRVTTPKFSSPVEVFSAIAALSKNFEPFTKVSAGFPGYVRDGIVFTAPNLGTDQWKGFRLAEKLSDLLKRPARVVNDADLQGLGVASGKGLEMVVTLGTGFGTALLLNGKLLPHLELAHHPVKKHASYDEYIGNKALESIGLEKWNKRMKKVIETLKTVINYDRLFISGGNAKKLNFLLDNNITIVANIDGIRGGAKLWQDNP